MFQLKLTQKKNEHPQSPPQDQALSPRLQKGRPHQFQLCSRASHELAPIKSSVAVLTKWRATGTEQFSLNQMSGSPREGGRSKTSRMEVGVSPWPELIGTLQFSPNTMCLGTPVPLASRVWGLWRVWICSSPQEHGLCPSTGMAGLPECHLVNPWDFIIWCELWAPADWELLGLIHHLQSHFPLNYLFSTSQVVRQWLMLPSTLVFTKLFLMTTYFCNKTGICSSVSPEDLGAWTLEVLCYPAGLLPRPVHVMPQGVWKGCS